MLIAGAGGVGRDVRIGNRALGARPTIVAAGGEPEIEALVAARDADVLELRADLFANASPAALVAALGRLRAAGKPIILTVRGATEGGRPLPEAARADLYAVGLPLADAVDVEIAASDLVSTLVPRARETGRTVILSFHDFAATPPAATLLGLVDQAERLGADVTKLVGHARDLADVQTLLEVTLAARRRGVVTLAMGAVGAVSRLLFPAAGSLLTYGSVGAPTAPGQLPVGELAGLVRRFFPPA